MKKLFALLLALCLMGGTLVAGADETLETLEAGKFSFVFPEDYDLAVENPYTETTYVTLTFDETTGEPYEKEIRYGGATVVYRDEWINIATKYVDELPMEASHFGSVFHTASSEAEAAFYYQFPVYAHSRYSIPIEKVADVGMFNMKPVYFAVYDIGFDESDGTSYYEWQIDMVFYYEGCILTCFMTTFELSEAEINEAFDVLSSLMQCVRPTGMTDDELAALKAAQAAEQEAAQAAEQEAAQEDLPAAIIGVWNIDLKTLYMIAGMSSAEADLMLSSFPQSATYTFTADHRYIMTISMNGDVTQEEGSYQLDGDQLIMDGGVLGTLILNDDTLTIVDATGLSLPMTRASSDVPATSTQPAKPAVETNDDAAEAAPTQYVVITNSSANIRSGPGGDYAKVTTARQGDTFPLIGEDGNWYIIDVNGQTGYVTKSLSAIQ